MARSRSLQAGPRVRHSGVEAIVLGEQALLQATSPATQSFLMLSIAFAQVEKGDHEAAHATVQEAVRQAPWMNQKMYRWFYRTQNGADLERFMAAMARAAMPEGS